MWWFNIFINYFTAKGFNFFRLQLRLCIINNISYEWIQFMPHFWFSIILSFFNIRLWIFINNIFFIIRFFDWLISTVVNKNIVLIRTQINLIIIFFRIIKIIFFYDFIIPNVFNFNIINTRMVAYIWIKFNIINTRVIFYIWVKFNIINIRINRLLFEIERIIIFFDIFWCHFFIDRIFFNCVMTVVYNNRIII